MLTPKHITEFFCDLVDLSKNDVVFDNCCGTGGFLISAMRDMIKKTAHNSTEEQEIKTKRIIGIEYQDSIFPLACSNMILHGDGQTNLYHADCFKLDSVKLRERHKPTVGFLNPPYKADKKDREEFAFVLNNLATLTSGGRCVALIPMSCVLATKGVALHLKEQLLSLHTLEAVMSLPNDLFHDSKVGVGTCAVLFTAHKPHKKGYKTYFGYLKEDGFVKRKNKGRVDGGNWATIKHEWLTSVRNKEIISGLSVMQEVTASDEWCVEAYMVTDYSQLTQSSFEKTLRNYAAFKVLHE